MFYIDGAKIRDEYGRERIFRGMNFCFKITNMDEAESFFKKIKNFDNYTNNLFDVAENYGTNLIRLGFTWSMLEPKEGEFDSRAFDLIKRFANEADKRGIYVLLDCHQDLFFSNKGIGDGAPEWLTKDYKKQKPLVIWAEGYFYMKSIQQAFNDFWDNKNAMQDKFVKLWKRVIDEFKTYDNVIAYDYLNEPMIYGSSNKVFCTMINTAIKEGIGEDFNAEKYFQGNNEKIGFVKMSLAIYKKIKTIGNLKKFLKALDSYEKFSNVVNACYEHTKDFASDYYQGFIDKMANECGDDKHFNFFEHSYYNNLGLPFEIECKDNYIYSPHAYDVFIDSPLYNKYSSNERIKVILDGIKANQDSMNVPVVMGEWGGGANNGNAWIEHIDYIYNVLEENHWSNIYWAYRFKNPDFVKMINRPYPVAVCGDIIEYKSDSKRREFRLKYTCTEDKAKTIIFIPNKGFTELDNKIGENLIELTY